jgi:outer membrane protein OmpA-like peptidoglycan-associated protein
MRKHLLSLTAILAGTSALLLQTTAQAQELSLRLEPGVAIPVTAPQNNRFKVGGDLAVKPGITFAHYFTAGPAVSVLALPSNISGIDTGTAYTFGGFLQVKRPHDYEYNTDHGFAAVSPWADADLQYVATGPLDRLGYAVAAGASVPTSDSRNLWVGPFVRYQGVYQNDDGHPGFNTNNAKIVIVGLSVEIGENVYEKHAPVYVAPPPQVQPAPEPVVVVNTTPAPPTFHDQDVRIPEVVQFAYDSPVLDDTANAKLLDVVKQITSAKNYKEIRIEGHASSEGAVKYNDALSLARANSVLEYLVANGIPREKLTSVGFGSRVPVATNVNEVGRSKNRRVDFEINFVIVKEVK